VGISVISVYIPPHKKISPPEKFSYGSFSPVSDPRQIRYRANLALLASCTYYPQTVELAHPKQHHVTPIRPIRIGSADQLSSADSTQPLMLIIIDSFVTAN